MKISKIGKIEAGTLFNIDDEVFYIQGKKIKKGVVYRIKYVTVFHNYISKYDRPLPMEEDGVSRALEVMNDCEYFITGCNGVGIKTGKVSADKAVLEAMLNPKNV